MRTRIFSGAVLLALGGLVAWLRGPLLVGAILLAIGLAAAEFYAMARAGGFHPWAAGGVVLALALALPAAGLALRPLVEALPGNANPAQIGLVLAGARPDLLETTTLVLAAAGLLVTLVWRGVRDPHSAIIPTGGASTRPSPLRGGAGGEAGAAGEAVDRPWADVGLTLAGALYTGGILKYGLLLNRAPGEIWWILLVVLGTAAADSGAYFVGRALGRRKLIPHISPNKTWAGFWGGLACCVLVVALFAGPMRIPAWHVLPLGLALGLSSVAGDLAESLLKRSFGVKDSGRLIPGHGGLLDRLDSILFVLLIVYGYTQYFYTG